jgi:uracil-DNA glycosylase
MKQMINPLQSFLSEIQRCRLCENHLPLGPKPILQLHSAARILIVGQAPGVKAHDSGTPWNDASGERLRLWMGLTPEEFYDNQKVAIVPMGFCYPGRGKSGDLPPRPECSKQWMQKILKQLPNVELKILIGTYAQNYFLKENRALLTENIRNWKSFLPEFILLPHPSPRNNIWLKKNAWFEAEILPTLKSKCKELITPQVSAN